MEENFNKKKQGNTFVEDMGLTEEDFRKKYKGGQAKILSEEFNRTFKKRKLYNLRLVEEQRYRNSKTLCENVSFEDKCNEAILWMRFMIQV